MILSGRGDALVRAGFEWQTAQTAARVVARNVGQGLRISKKDQVNTMKWNRNLQSNSARSTRMAGIGCMIIAASVALTFASPAKSEDTGIKEDVKRAGQAVGDAAREVGHEAKNIGTEIGQGAKKVGGEIAEGARKAGTEIAQGAKKVGAEIGAGAKTAGRVVGNAARQTAEAVRDTPKNIKESMTGERKE